jgi:CDP-paratose 2-epimerase
LRRENELKVLIVGGAGFIGVNAAESYLREGAKVTILDNFAREGSRLNVARLTDNWRDVEVVAADIRTDRALLCEHAARAELILHVAAQVAVTTSVLDPRTDFEINALGTLNVLEAARESNCGQTLIYASTNKVYGGLEHLAVTERNGRYEFAHGGGVSEDTQLDFHSPYGCSKGAAEQYVRDYARIYGLRTVVFRQSCIYGPHQFGVEDQGWVAWFSIRASLGKSITIYGDGRQLRDVLYVSDLIDAYRLAHERIAQVSGQIYNMGGGPRNMLSLLELISLLEQRYNRKLDVSFSDWRPGDQRVFVAAVDKAERELGWVPKVGVTQGVEKLCSWIDDNSGLFRPQPLAAV